MRFLIISMGLVMSLGLNGPVLSQSTGQVAQSPSVADSNSRQLRMNRRLWNQQNISNYRYTLSNGCFCTSEARGPVIIEVRNGSTTSITNASTGQPVNRELFQKYSTVPKLFDLIQSPQSRKAYSLTVQYDPTLGYPTQINIDYNSQIADEELYLTIENLQEIR